MRAAWVHAAIAALAITAALAWPLSPALETGTLRATRLTALLASAAICAGIALVPARMRRSTIAWSTGAVLALGAAAVLLFAHIEASSSCVAEYDDRQVVVGRELQSWVRPEPGASSKSLLFDAAGDPAGAWTPKSIDRCRWLLGWSIMLAIPLFALAGAAGFQVVQHRYPSFTSAKPAATRTAAQQHSYDAFISYRHIEPDRTFALELLSQLEAKGMRVLIDVRDFVPNRHFLSEMERCTKESRFVLCVITSGYIASDHCLEEAVLSKTMDMSERRQRIVPLILERVELPVWLHGIVGIDFTPDCAVDPYERLLALMTSPKQ